MHIKRLIQVIGTSFSLALIVPLAASAASNVVVTPSDKQGWSEADTNSGGDVKILSDNDAPIGAGALQLTTTNSSSAKAQFMHTASVPLSQVTTLSYQTKQISGPAVAEPSYQLPVCLNGTTDGQCHGYTTMVYEPYWNDTTQPITQGSWQTWDAASGQWWSNKTVSNADNSFTVTAGGGGQPFYTLAMLRDHFPDATVVGFGVNIGSNNANYVVRTDAFNFNGTVYDFEVKPYVATDKDQCKNNGWKNFQTTYKNQGDCVSSVVSKGANSSSSTNSNDTSNLSNNPTF